MPQQLNLETQCGGNIISSNDAPILAVKLPQFSPLIDSSSIALKSQPIVTASESKTTAPDTVVSQSKSVLVPPKDKLFKACWRVVQGSASTYDSDKRIVQDYVKNNLFSKVKFIIDDGELEYTGKFVYLSLYNFLH